MAKTPSSQLGGESGFTLVEALIAIIVLVFGLIGVTNLFVVAKTTTSLANQSSAATTAASETLERLKATTFFPDFVNLAPGGNGGTVTDGVGCGTPLATGCGCEAPGSSSDPQLNTPVSPLDPTWGKYWRCDRIPGVGQIYTQWQIAQVGTNTDLYLITVRSEGSGMARRRSRAEFTMFRSCTGPKVVNGCPS